MNTKYTFKALLCGISIWAGMSLGLTSCESYLDVDSYFYDQTNIDSIFQSKVRVNEYINGIATILPNESKLFTSSYFPFGMGSDECFASWADDYGKNEKDPYRHAAMALLLGNETPQSANYNNWGSFYKGIRKANIVVTRIYDRTLIAVFKENRKVLREMVRESNELFYQSRERKYSLLPTLRKLQKGDIDTAHYYVQVVDYLNEMTKALAHITRPAFEHIDNNHEGLSKEQTEDLMHINDEVESIYRHINNMLRTGDFSDLDMVLEMRDRLFEAIADAIKSEVTRINENRSNTKASILYLTILNETKSMVLQSRNLLKSQRYFLEHKDGPLQWLNKIK